MKILLNGSKKLEKSGIKVSKYLLDTNSIIYALNSEFKFPRHEYVVSVISEIELLSYDKLSVEDNLMLKDALSCFELIDLTNDV